MANKVKFNLKNVFYSVVTENAGSDGKYTYSYATPVAIPGAVSLSLDAQGETNYFYADGIRYYQSVSSAAGYSGDLTVALIPKQFKKDVLGMKETEDGIIVEDATAVNKPFALLFQFDGDEDAIKYVMYNCVATRPSIGSETNEDSIEVRTETMTVSCAPRRDGIVQALCDNKSAAAYSTWTSAVYQPVLSE